VRKRSKYKPRQIIPDTMTWVRAGLKKVDKISAGTTLKIRNHDAINNLRLGVATRHDIDAIIDVLNITEALATEAWARTGSRRYVRVKTRCSNWPAGAWPTTSDSLPVALSLWL
jgi:hypothetical protein